MHLVDLRRRSANDEVKATYQLGSRRTVRLDDKTTGNAVLGSFGQLHQ